MMTSGNYKQFDKNAAEAIKKLTPKRIRRKAGEHIFSNPTNGIPRCIDCGCDEDDAFVGGEECTFGK